MGLQAVAGFLLDESLKNWNELRHNFNKIGQWFVFLYWVGRSRVFGKMYIFFLGGAFKVMLILKLVPDPDSYLSGGSWDMEPRRTSATDPDSDPDNFFLLPDHIMVLAWFRTLISISEPNLENQYTCILVSGVILKVGSGTKRRYHRDPVLRIQIQIALRIRIIFVFKVRISLSISAEPLSESYSYWSQSRIRNRDFL